MKVVFVCDWGETSADLLARLARQTPSQSGQWKELKGVDDAVDAEVCVALDGLPTGFSFDPRKTILITREPDFIKQPATAGFRHVHTWNDGHCGVTWWLGRTYDELLRMEYPAKTLDASCVSSNKHKQRKKFIKKVFGRRRLLRSFKTGIHLYGRGHSVEKYGANYKGEIVENGNCKLPGLERYRYSLVLENSSQMNYWTEKLADALLAWCVPVYWGCPNIGDFFDDGVVMEIGLDAGPREINRLVSAPVRTETVEKLRDAREKILNEYNIWEVVRKVIEKKIL